MFSEIGCVSVNVKVDIRHTVAGFVGLGLAGVVLYQCNVVRLSVNLVHLQKDSVLVRVMLHHVIVHLYCDAVKESNSVSLTLVQLSSITNTHPFLQRL